MIQSENLTATHFRNGDEIPHCESDAAWVDAAEKGRPAWCYVEGRASDPLAMRGKLYNWYALMDPRGLLPKGSRLATLDELLALKGDQIHGMRRLDLIRIPSHSASLSRVEYCRTGEMGYFWLPETHQDYEGLKGKMVCFNGATGERFCYFAEKGNGLSVRVVIRR